MKHPINSEPKHQRTLTINNNLLQGEQGLKSHHNGRKKVLRLVLLNNIRITQVSATLGCCQKVCLTVETDSWETSQCQSMSYLIYGTHSRQRIHWCCITFHLAFGSELNRSVCVVCVSVCVCINKDRVQRVTLSKERKAQPCSLITDHKVAA